MKPEVALYLMEKFYKNVLRDVMVKVAEHTDFVWDNNMLELCDKIFGYNSRKKDKEQIRNK